MISGEPSVAAEVETLRRAWAELSDRVAALETRLAPPAVVIHGYDGREPEVLAGADSSLLAWGEHLLTEDPTTEGPTQ